MDKYSDNGGAVTNTLCHKAERKCEKKIRRELRICGVKKYINEKNEISVLVEELNQLANRKREVKYDERMAFF